jgi:hypothetical protein
MKCTSKFVPRILRISPRISFCSSATYRIITQQAHEMTSVTHLLGDAPEALLNCVRTCGLADAQSLNRTQRILTFAIGVGSDSAVIFFAENTSTRGIEQHYWRPLYR